MRLGRNLARLRDEAEWLRFVVPRLAVQVLAGALPLARIRDALPAFVTRRLRSGLYPAKVAPSGDVTCARSHPEWGDPATLDPALPVRYEAPPVATVVVLTYGNLVLTRLCLASLQRAAGPVPFEILVVDNASPDGGASVAWLREAAARGLLPLRLVENAENRGFAGANNQAARLARGRVLVLLNNDTVVTPGWLDGLVLLLDGDAALGLVGPRTNSSGNPEVDVAAPYVDLPSMIAFAKALRERAATGPSATDVAMLPLFCAALRTADYLALGGLDEGYGRGMFEDDDLALAVRRRGLRVAVAEGVFVHHYGGAAFSRLPQLEYLRLFWENRRRFERKWGVPWQQR